MLGLSYGQLDYIKEYLSNLNEWCKEESKVCDEHRAEREAQRELLHKDETLFSKHQFALIFYSSLELIRVITQVGREKDVEPSIVINSFLALFKEAGLPPPDGLSQFLKAFNTELKVDESIKATIDIRLFIKENFDMIGMLLLEDLRNKELLINLGGVLSSLEQLGKTKTDQN